MERNSVFLVYTSIEQSESVSDCHALYATFEHAKAAMDREIPHGGRLWIYGRN